MVDSNLLAGGPGKKGDGSEDHTVIMKKLYAELKNFIESLTKKPKCFQFVSRAHEGFLCNFYVNSNIEYIMDNPERRANFGLLAGNSSIHTLFGLSCIFKKLQKPFHACNRCCQELSKYCLHKNWNFAPPEPKCESCHGFLLKNLLESGSYTEPIYKPPKDLIEHLEDIPGSSFFKNKVKY